MKLFENIPWNIRRTLYAFQVIIIALAIPILSYMEMTHVQKEENQSAKGSVVISKYDAPVLSLK